jgi:hypothetical protein
MTEASISKSLNSTAYRIYRILEWLVEKPLTLTEINLKFKADPLIGKVVSSDSILLYMNTLKAIGCEIQRPSPKNSFHYMLLYHPFGMTLTEQHIQLLIKVKSKKTVFSPSYLKKAVVWTMESFRIILPCWRTAAKVVRHC